MTNREYVINLLSNKDFIDDNRASYESVVLNAIDCPYTDYEQGLCSFEECSDDTCFKCKENWLNSEVQ